MEPAAAAALPGRAVAGAGDFAAGFETRPARSRTRSRSALVLDPGTGATLPVRGGSGACRHTAGPERGGTGAH